MNVMHSRYALALAAILACHRPARQPDTNAAPASDTSAPGPGPSLRSGRQDTTTSLRSGRQDTTTSLRSGRQQEDTARGIVAVVGTDRSLRVVLKQANGASGVTLAGDETRAMSSVAGADVWVTGTRMANGDLQVARFVVRSVDGVPAIDGTLELSGSQYYIVTADHARHVINNVPDVLRQQVGKRVWATGQLAQGPVTFGVIEVPKSTR